MMKIRIWMIVLLFVRSEAAPTMRAEQQTLSVREKNLAVETLHEMLSQMGGEEDEEEEAEQRTAAEALKKMPKREERALEHAVAEEALRAAAEEDRFEKANAIRCPVLAAMYRNDMLSATLQGDKLLVSPEQLRRGLDAIGASPAFSNFLLTNVSHVVQGDDTSISHDPVGDIRLSCAPWTRCGILRRTMAVNTDNGDGSFSWASESKVNTKTASRDGYLRANDGDGISSSQNIEIDLLNLRGLDFVHGMRRTGLRKKMTATPKGGQVDDDERIREKRFDTVYLPHFKENRLSFADLASLIRALRTPELKQSDLAADDIRGQNTFWIDDLQTRLTVSAMIVAFGRMDSNSDEAGSDVAAASVQDMYITRADAETLLIDGTVPDGWFRRSWGLRECIDVLRASRSSDARFEAKEKDFTYDDKGRTLVNRSLESLYLHTFQASGLSSSCHWTCKSCAGPKPHNCLTCSDMTPHLVFEALGSSFCYECKRHEHCLSFGVTQVCDVPAYGGRNVCREKSEI